MGVEADMDCTDWAREIGVLLSVTGMGDVYQKRLSFPGGLVFLGELKI